MFDAAISIEASFPTTDDVSPRAVTMPIGLHLAAGTQPVETSLPPKVGAYRVLELLARGGMGGVYLGEHVDTGERVALKVLEPRWAQDHGVVARMLDEAEVTRRVRHRGLVRILSGERRDDGIAYLAMELIDGMNLGVLLDHDRLELGAIAAIGAQIADAVAALHEAGIIHCDLKPDNVMVEYRDGLAGWPRIKVIDFGVARLHPRHEVAGTPHYMAPEQWRGHAEPRTDVYALGCLLYELITGDVPFDGSLPQLMAAHCDDRALAPSLVRWCPEIIERLVLRMLAKEPGMRPHMDEVARTLADVAFQFPPGARHERERDAVEVALAAG